MNSGERTTGTSSFLGGSHNQTTGSGFRPDLYVVLSFVSDCEVEAVVICQFFL